MATLVTVATLCISAVQASGQEGADAAGAGYDSIPMNENLANDSKGTLEKAVISAAKAYSSGSKADINYVKAFFQLYMPAKMTGPMASPSRPSVRLTALDVPVSTNIPKRT